MRLGDDGADALLVRRIEEGKQQADRDGLHVCGDQVRDRAMHAVFVERGQHAALRVESFPHFLR